MLGKKWLLSNMFLRNMLADFGGRSIHNVPGNFTPYFQYKTGPYQSDHYLYFPKEPFPTRYKNEVFKKLFEYNGYDIVHNLEFHYASYPDQSTILRFLQYEIADGKSKP